MSKIVNFFHKLSVSRFFFLFFFDSIGSIKEGWILKSLPISKKLYPGGVCYL